MGSVNVLKWRVIVAISSLAAIADIETQSQLIKDNCTCPSDILTYNCNVTGSGFTIWRGSAFNCNGDSRIRLRHSSFVAGTMGLCNDGAIIGRSLGTNTDGSISPVYMSQLIINLTESAASSIVGQMVECVYLDSSGMETTIGSMIIDITDPLPPPTNIQLVSVSSEQLAFNWTSVDSTCSTFRYNIVFNCGSCPDIENTTSSVTCSIADLSTNAENMMQCSFSVQSVLCADTSGNFSIPLNVTLKFPQSPVITNVILHYNQTNNQLIDYNIKFSEVDTFTISNGIDGSALHYIINFTDTNAGDVCDSFVISASSCDQGVCTVPSIPLPCSNYSSEDGQQGDIDISISAINLLGEGPPSFTSLSRTKFVVISDTLTSQLTNQIICVFPNNQQGQGTISCDVSYGPCQQPNMTAQGTVASSSPNTVKIDLPLINPQTEEYCYVVNASNGTFTVLTELDGLTMPSIITGDESLSPNVLVIVIPIIGALGILCMVMLVLVLFISWRSRNKPSQMQKIPVHITFILKDKPTELMNALEKLNEFKINYKNVKVGPQHTISEDPVRKIYVECEEAPSREQKEKIEGLQIGISNSLKVFRELQTEECYKQGRNEESRMVYLRHEAGALLLLLKLIYSTDQECNSKHINITDIDVQHDTEMEGFACVTIYFLPGISNKWVEVLGGKLQGCELVRNHHNESNL